MIHLFRKKSAPAEDLKFADLDGNLLHEGDIVASLRYDLGRCRIIREGTGFSYESLENGRKVDWTRMIDAASGNQKVRKA